MTAHIDIDRFLALEARLDECERHIAWLRAADRHADPASYPPGVILNPHGPPTIGNGAGCRLTAAPGSDAAADIEIIKAELADMTLIKDKYEARYNGLTGRATAKCNSSVVQGWVNCDDHLPPDLEAVLCACTDTDDGLGPAVYAGFRANGHWISQDKNGLGDPLDNDIAFPVSHWMPLPSAPRTAPSPSDQRADQETSHGK